MVNGYPIEQLPPTPIEEAPKPRIGAYLALGVVVLVVVGGIIVALVFRGKLIGKPSAPTGPVSGTVLVPAREPTQEEKDSLGLSPGAMIEKFQTPDGPTDVIVFPDKTLPAPQNRVQSFP